MPAKVLADFIQKCVRSGATIERDSCLLHLYLIHILLEKESGEKESPLYFLFDNREP